MQAEFAGAAMRHAISATCWAFVVLLVGGKQLRKPEVDTLVLYVFHYTDIESTANLEFFFNHGIKEHDGAHYYVLIQESDRAEVAQVILTGKLWLPYKCRH